MKILITGASGFLGSWFLDHYLRSDEDWEIWTVDIKPHPTGIPVDLEDLESWLNTFKEDHIDLVYHFAAPVGGREKIEGDPLFNADSLRLDSVMFRWAIEHATTLVYPSSSAVYGTVLQKGDGEPLTEHMFEPRTTTWYAPDEMYGFTKLAGEMLAYKAAKYGLNTLCIRPFSGYGEGQPFDYPMPSIARRAVLREDPLVVWGPGTQERDFIHVSDIVGATIAKLNAGVAGYEALNLGSGVPTSFNRVAEIAAEIAGYYPRIENLTDKPVGVNARYCDPTRMQQFYMPLVSLRDGIRRMMEHIERDA